MDLTNCFIFFLLLTSLYFALTRKTPPKKHPPGSMGFPLIGQTLSFLHAMRTNSIEQWLLQRTSKYGPVSKLSLFGTPTVFVHGQSANKFIFTCDGNVLGNHQPPSFKRICGERNMTALIGDDHKRVRGALVSFLKPEMLKQYVGKMDEEVRNHVEMHWHGNQKVMVMPLMKTLTFNMMSSLIFGIGKGETRNNLIELLQHMMNGLMSLPINLPFTRFNRSLKASAQLRAFIKNLISERKAALEQRVADTRKDLIACLLGIGKTEPSIRMSDEEIVDNVISVMIAGYDTSSVLITFLVRLLGMDRSVYDKIVQVFLTKLEIIEQEKIAKTKTSELLSWDDLAKMKYTWRVAMETLRMNPPLLGSLRKVLKDFEYEGYTIPKGWQVIRAANMTHMDERIFSDPSKFDPARFEKQASIPPYCFVAFGGGARICPGNEFARIETLVTIHYLVTRFKWKLCCLDNSFSRNPFPVFNDGMLIEIEPKDC
ncbi:hypothetical protein ES288_D10G015100v1 [Gossypium darwinii]|uniref:Cytochrome P450 n=1 Tax=Gossypium darwinii TaxID=34276 RepID=A0A5D2AV25_GOSDA|nr:hypothetical protein ES288_D10G015100v1 [Gossypium darwinii]